MSAEYGLRKAEGKTYSEDGRLKGGRRERRIRRTVSSILSLCFSQPARTKRTLSSIDVLSMVELDMLYALGSI